MKTLYVIIFFLFSTGALLAQDDNAINFQVTKENAQFPGGEVAFYKFIIDRMQVLYDEGIVDRKGKVVAQFTIDTAGNVRDVAIVESLSPELDQACIQILKQMPPWIPGTYINKIKKETQFAVPFQFIKPTR